MNTVKTQTQSSSLDTHRLAHGLTQTSPSEQETTMEGKRDTVGTSPAQLPASAARVAHQCAPESKRPFAVRHTESRPRPARAAQCKTRTTSAVGASQEAESWVHTLRVVEGKVDLVRFGSISTVDN